MVFKKKSKANAKSKASVRSIEDIRSKTAVDTSEDDPATSASEAFSEDISTSKYRIQNSTEEDFEIFEVVKKGDIEAIKIILESEEFKNNGDINRIDINGYTMLHHAVIHQYEKVVELLLQQEGIFVFDTLYYAIQEENVDIVQQLILFTHENPESVDDAPERDSDFPKSLTPFMLACTQGSLELIKLLYKVGVQKTTSPFITINVHATCAPYILFYFLNSSKGLNEDRNRLTLWQAFSNPVYISFMTGQVKGFDPVQEAFYLIGILKHDVIPNEVIFTPEYMELKENLEAFTVDLLGMCLNRYDTELMLKAERDNKETTEPFPRLQWAMRLKHSDFVTHQHAQSLVYKWRVADGWPAWPSLHPVVKALHFLSRLILFIPASVLLLFDRESSLGKFFATPLNIFLNSVASYMVFLIVLILQVLNPYQRCNTPENLKEEDICTEKGPPRTGTELVILIFVLGFMVSSVKHFWPSKKGFLRQKWNVFNVVMQVCFLIVFVFWGLAYLDWTSTLEATNSITPELHRHMWESTDPILIAEAFFGVATILSISKLLQFVQVQEYYGPIQAGLGSIIHRALATGFVFLYVLIAFGAGISGNYKAYLDQGDKVEVGDSYATFWGATHQLFYGLHWLYEHGDLKIGLKETTTEVNGVNVTTTPNDHIVNEYVGQAMAVIFQIYAWIMMMNMLIAFFFTNFGDIQDNLANTWKYVRTEKLRESKQEASNRKVQYLGLIKKFTLQYLDMVDERSTEELAEADDVKEINEELDELRSLMKERGLNTPKEEPVDETRNKRFEEYQQNKATLSDTGASTSEMELSKAPSTVPPPAVPPVSVVPSKTASVTKQIPSKTGLASPSATPSVAAPPLPPKASSVVIQQPQGLSGLVTASPSASKETTIKAPPSASK